MKRNLATSGLSLSQAQSISNLCNQRAQDITAQLAGINNVEKSLEWNGKVLIQTPGKKLPGNVKDLLMEKSKLHACQAFLMEHIKLKEVLLKETQRESFSTKLESPKIPDLKDHISITPVDEAWGWAQLTNSEKNEYLECEAYAAHIGQFIHKSGVLDNLRTELPNIKTLEWMEIKKDEKVPLTVTSHPEHTPEALLALHNDLAGEHRKFEQRVNYFKAKVKNLVTTENARIANENANAQSEANAFNQTVRGEFQKLYADYQEAVRKESHEFEKSRQDNIKVIAGLRIDVDTRFQETIDLYLKQVTEQ